ncbi:MAG: hypothetical protein ACRDRP_07585 [Pseudonocardiaceae bacterium]
MTHLAAAFAPTPSSGYRALTGCLKRGDHDRPPIPHSGVRRRFPRRPAAAVRDRQAATAAGMITIAHGFTGDGARWLVDHVPHRGGPRLEPAQLSHARHPYPDDGLAAALGTYRALVDRDCLDIDQVLADLLHLHHARMIGVGTASERHCLRLARAVAHTDLLRRTS